MPNADPVDIADPVDDANPVNIDQHVRLLTESQQMLYAFIRGLVIDMTHTNDVLQNTNEVLWKKRGDFTLGTDFGAWARTIAFYEVLAFRKKRQTDRHVFDDELIGQMADEMGDCTTKFDLRQEFLDDCLRELPNAQRESILARYQPGMTISHMASLQKRSLPAISQSLYRIRNRLLDCIESKLAKARAE